MAVNQSSPFESLAKEILKLWEQIRTFRNLEKHDVTLRRLIQEAENCMLAGEWGKGLEECGTAFSLLEHRRSPLSADNGLQEGFCRAVIGLHLGIAHIAFDDLGHASARLQESAKHFELARFPLGASLAHIALGKFLRLHDDCPAACRAFEESQTCLRLGFLVPPDAKTQACKEKLEADIQQELDALGCKMAGESRRPAASSPSASANAVPRPSEKPLGVNLGVLPVNSIAIMAGEPGVLFDDITDYATTDRVLIRGNTYGLFRFDGERSTLEFHPRYEYRAVPVKGRSMNRRFAPGEFVVLRVPKDGYLSADSGAIVAAQIVTRDLDAELPSATLKEYRRLDDGSIELRPLTTDDLVRNPLGPYPLDAVRVRAIAVGVLRRLND